MHTPGLAPSFATHCASLVHLVHCLFVQIGVVPEQSLSLRHCTQCSADVSHTGADAFLQWLELTHSTHLLAVSHAGMVEVLQSESPPHSTHVPAAALHTGSVAFLVAQPSTGASWEPQATQVCEVPQMGLLGSLQSVLLRQPTQRLVVVLQKPATTPPSAPPSTPPSASPVQSLVVTHSTHLPLVDWHTGAALFLISHSLAAELHPAH
jgi:hypothetical protein